MSHRSAAPAMSTSDSFWKWVTPKNGLAPKFFAKTDETPKAQQNNQPVRRTFLKTCWRRTLKLGIGIPFLRPWHTQLILSPPASLARPPRQIPVSSLLPEAVPLELS
eukprot:2039087-Amphidinium_carterae.1